MLFYHAIASVLVIVLIIAVGYVLAARGWFGRDFAGGVSSLVIRVALPCAIFTSMLRTLHREQLASLTAAFAFPLVQVALSYAVGLAACRLFRVRPGRRGSFVNTVANTNTIFIGMPLNVALFGSHSVVDMLGPYVVCLVSTWTLGLFLMQRDDPTRPAGIRTRLDWRHLVSPPLAGFLLALLFVLAGLRLPSFLLDTTGYLGDLVTPLSLIYIGIVLQSAGLRSIRFDRDSILALAGRFLVAPALMIGLVVLGLPGLGRPDGAILTGTLIVQSATPTIAVLPMLAASAHADVHYATNMVTASTVLFVLVVPVLMWVTSLL